VGAQTALRCGLLRKLAGRLCVISQSSPLLVARSKLHVTLQRGHNAVKSHQNTPTWCVWVLQPLLAGGEALSSGVVLSQCLSAVALLFLQLSSYASVITEWVNSIRQ
jgi:hypothetical protein